MKLSWAKFCVECEEIVAPGCRACPSCTCTQFVPLAILPGVLRNDSPENHGPMVETVVEETDGEKIPA